VAGAHDVRGLRTLSLVVALLAGRGDADEAISALAGDEPHMTLEERIQTRYLLWRATGDRAHLARADDGLRHLRDHAPRELRDSMILAVRMHRDIEQATEAQGE
jgi:hypothetical protein